MTRGDLATVLVTSEAPSLQRFIADHSTKHGEEEILEEFVKLPSKSDPALDAKFRELCGGIELHPNCWPGGYRVPVQTFK